MRPTTKISPWMLAAVLAVLPAGCSGTTAPSTGPDASPASSATTKPRALPGPFEITARSSAASLGLKRLKGSHRGAGGGPRRWPSGATATGT
jgi:hypothetical protein